MPSHAASISNWQSIGPCLREKSGEHLRAGGAFSTLLRPTVTSHGDTQIDTLRRGHCARSRAVLSNAQWGGWLHEQSLHVGRDLGREGWCDVAVGVQGEPDGAVAEEFLDHLGVYAAAEEVSRCCMPKIMNPNAWQASLIERPMKLCGRPCSVGWPSDLRSKD